MKTFILISVLLLSGCATPDQNARSILDRLEFDEDEIGCVDLRATIDLNPIPLITTNASLILKKSKGEDAPEC